MKKNITKLQFLKTEQALLESSIDQLEAYLYDNIEEVIDIIEKQPLIEEYGDVVAGMLTFAYAKLLGNTTSQVLEKLEQNNINLNS